MNEYEIKQEIQKYAELIKADKVSEASEHLTKVFGVTISPDIIKTMNSELLKLQAEWEEGKHADPNDPLVRAELAEIIAEKYLKEMEEQKN